MNDDQWLTEQFEEHRTRLRAVAYRMLGSVGEADDAIQEAWIRASAADTTEVRDPGAWLTTIVARVSLNVLRARKARPEDPVGAHIPEPVIDPPEGMQPEHETLLADAVGMALLVVLDTLSPPERLAYVLHDMFDVPFDRIAPIVDRSPDATRQLASRARRRIRDSSPPEDDGSPAQQRATVDAFLAAAREGDLRRLIAVLDPDVLLRADLGTEGGPVEAHGPEAVAERAETFGRMGLDEQPVLVNGAAGVVCRLEGELFSVLGFTFTGGRIAGVDILADPERLARVDFSGVSA